jgi:hypothetical protein
MILSYFSLKCVTLEARAEIDWYKSFGYIFSLINMVRLPYKNLAKQEPSFRQERTNYSTLFRVPQIIGLVMILFHHCFTSHSGLDDPI